MEWLGTVLSALPLGWLIAALTNVGWGWVVYKLWQRNNEMQDARVKDVAEYSDKLHDIIDKSNQTIRDLISFVRGGK